MSVLPIVPIRTLMAHLDERPTGATLHKHTRGTPHSLRAISGNPRERGGFCFIGRDDMRRGIQRGRERAPAPGRG